MPQELLTQGHQFVGTNEAKTPQGRLTVKATSQTLVNANGNRIGIYIFNPSAKEVWLCLGTEAAEKEKGIWLKKEAGQIFLQGYTGAVTCITSEGEGVVSFVEF